VAFIGPLSVRQHASLSADLGKPHDLNRAYTSIRQIKSPEELDWFRIGAYFADLGMAALRNSIRPGIGEIELAARIEQAYVPLGGGHAIHFVGVTSMEAPTVPVHRQFPSRRRVEVGDAVSAEISAAFWDHPGQVLRSFTVSKPPNSLYRDLHHAADAAFDAVCSVLRPGALPVEVMRGSASSTICCTAMVVVIFRPSLEAKADQLDPFPLSHSELARRLSFSQMSSHVIAKLVFR
jgi:Xaa-Pro dipeptidase